MTKDENLYGTKCIQIPTPQFVIFYNGSQEQPDRKILRLSDAYCVKEEHPALELTAVMLNINRGHNEKLKEMCKSLKDYSEYTARVREYAQVKPVEEAVEHSIPFPLTIGIPHHRFTMRSSNENTKLISHFFEIGRAHV